MNRIEKIWFLNGLLFALLFLSVSCFNRFAEDDFLFLETVKQKGIVFATLAHYHSWNTRWLSIAWLNTWYWLIDNGIPIFVFNWLGLVFMIFCFYSFLSTVSVPFFKVGVPTNLSRKQRVMYSTTFCACFFFCTFNTADAWFWINSTTMYLWNIGFACLGLSILIKKKGYLKTTDYLLLCLCGLYIGAASEPFLIVILLTIAVLFVINALTNHIHLKQFFNSKFAVALFWLSILFSFLIAWYGSGHGARSNVLPNTSLLSAITKSFYFTIKILGWHFSIHIFTLMLFSFPWFYLGYINQPQVKKIKLLPLYTKGILAILLFTYLNTLPIVYLMGDYGPSRAWTPISFYICIVTAFLFFQTGQQLKLRYFTAIRLFEVTGIIAFCFILITGTYYVGIARAYATTYDTEKPFTHLPESGWLHSAKPKTTLSN